MEFASETVVVWGVVVVDVVVVPSAVREDIHLIQSPRLPHPTEVHPKVTLAFGWPYM